MVSPSNVKVVYPLPQRKEKLLVCHRDWTVRKKMKFTLFKENPIQAKQANIGSHKEITTKMTKISNVQANIGSSEEMNMKMTKISNVQIQHLPRLFNNR